MRLRDEANRSRDNSTMTFPRMTWIGLLIATLGWGILICYPLVVSFTIDASQAQPARDPGRFIPLIGENTILTGMAIAILGALERALRLLSRISSNGAVARGAQPAMAARPAQTASSKPINVPAAAEPMLMSPRSAGDVVTRGALNGRDYVLFRDGSVVLETLLGPRRFASIGEAQEFIGAN
jgi:hypothetical protein